MKTLLSFVITGIFFFLAPVALFAQKNNVIYPKAIWKDNRGEHIQAHGGGIIKVKYTITSSGLAKILLKLIICFYGKWVVILSETW